MSKKILVAMSGGVDSTVAAKILKDQGHEVVGVFLKFWHEDEQTKSANECCSPQSFLDAKRVCAKINIPLYTLNYNDIFKNEVVDYFLDSYNSNKTPSPCLICNKKVKLGQLINYAKNLGFDYVASGHYARLKSTNKTIKLITAKDIKKNQAYFLSLLTQEELPYLLFPLGNYTKNQVRQMAKKWQLDVTEKKESQEVCFIHSSTKEFLQKNLKLKSGLIKNLQSEILGQHQGLGLYTLGQRQGINIGGRGPYYVLKKDSLNNDLIVTNDKNDPALFSKTATIKNINWLSGHEPKLPLKCLARHRYQTKLERVCIVPIVIPAELKVATTASFNGIQKKNYKITFKNPVRAITPGQFIVLYKPCGILAKLKNNYEVVGAGEIEE
ncbi:MAG TPA: tRNA 2-thiouridine(34) synthase MnmA [bacterium]|nr:tRNA 2-thiouridine(34) synthase MnmA [bacterium]